MHVIYPCSRWTRETKRAAGYSPAARCLTICFQGPDYATAPDEGQLAFTEAHLFALFHSSCAVPGVFSCLLTCPVYLYACFYLSFCDLIMRDRPAGPESPAPLPALSIVSAIHQLWQTACPVPIPSGRSNLLAHRHGVLIDLISSKTRGCVAFRET